MDTWRYLLTTKRGFPEPRYEIDSLAALEEEGTRVHLLLALGEHPMCSKAEPFDVLLLCVREAPGEPYLAVAEATVLEPAAYRETPEEHEGLYREAVGSRWWLPVSIHKFPWPQTAIDLGIDEADFQVGRRPTTKRLGRTSRKQRKRDDHASARPATTPPTHDLPKIHLPIRASTSVVGVDLTAGDPATAFDGGRKPFWAVHLSANEDGILLSDPVDKVSTLTELENQLRKRRADVVVIDGPCGTNGIRVDTAGGWSPEAPGVRTAERELSRRGVKLFWTTKATLEAFKGAREWILRSLVLFARLAGNSDPSPAARPLETHPHAFFFLLWQRYGTGRLEPKNKPPGREQRLALLRMFLELDEKQLPDDDAVDSMAAALLGVLFQAGCATAVGDDDAGGKIWIPDMDHPVFAAEGHRQR